MKVVRNDISKWLLVGTNVLSDAEPSRLWVMKKNRNGRGREECRR
jgi:hypothetical protein